MRNVQDIMVLAPGDILFQQGDPGGDLFFIQKGEIEIFTTKENIDVVLTVMKAGEVLGLMTFASTEPRMAGARAKSETVLKRVSKEQIAGQISAMPSWLKIVLKDLKFRITQMNAKYSASLERIRDLKKSQISYLYMVRQLCGLVVASAPKMSILVDDKKFVVVDELKDYVEQAMLLTEELTNKFFDILIEAGMLKIEIEPDRKRKVISLATAEKLMTFAQFIAEAGRGQTKKLLGTALSNRELRTASAVISYAKRKNMKLNGECALNTSDLEENLEKATGTKFEVAALSALHALKLVNFASDDELKFIPSQLSRTLTNVQTYKRIEKLHEHDLQMKKKGQAQKSA